MTICKKPYTAINKVFKKTRSGCTHVHERVTIWLRRKFVAFFLFHPLINHVKPRHRVTANKFLLAV